MPPGSFLFSPLAGLVEGSVALAVTNSFSQSLIICVVGGVLVAVGQVLVALVSSRDTKTMLAAIEEAKQLNRQNKELLHDIMKAQGVAKRRTDLIDYGPTGSSDPGKPFAGSG